MTHMTRLFASSVAALALGFGLTVTSAPDVSAQQAPVAQKSSGSVTLTQYRSRARHVHRHRHGGRIAAGIAAGIGTAIILNEVSRPSYGRTYYSDNGLSCGQLEARCDAGQDWACRRLDRDPNC